MRASPINPPDLLFAQNLYDIRSQLPSGVGFGGIGIVDALGEDVPIQTGTRASFTGIATWSEYVIVNQRSLIPVSDAIPDDHCSTVCQSLYGLRDGAGNGTGC